MFIEHVSRHFYGPTRDLQKLHYACLMKLLDGSSPQMGVSSNLISPYFLYRSKVTL